MTLFDEKNTQATLDFLLQKHEKEYHCHVQFVAQMALELSEKYGGSKECLIHAALLHDIGRGQELDGEMHEQAGVRIARDFLQTLKLQDEDRVRILRCIENHKGDLPIQSIEESIIISSDSASKLRYHSAFMLMCKKETFQQRAEWGLKYVKKGYERIVLPELKTEMRSEHERLRTLYDAVLAPVQSA